jgi:hypothetical protein
MALNDLLLQSKGLQIQLKETGNNRSESSQFKFSAARSVNNSLTKKVVKKFCQVAKSMYICI